MISRENVYGDEKVKGMRKVGESVNVKKMSTIWWAQFYFYFNLSKILNFLFFKTKRDRKYQ